MWVDPVKLIQFIVCQATEFGAHYLQSEWSNSCIWPLSITRGKTRRDAVESLYFYRVRHFPWIATPARNKVKRKFAMCEDIRRKFARGVGRQQLDDLRLLLGKGGAERFHFRLFSDINVS